MKQLIKIFICCICCIMFSYYDVSASSASSADSEELNFSGRKLPKEGFETSPQCRKLNLAWNDLTDDSPILARLPNLVPNLRELNLHGNKLTSLKGIAPGMKNLEKLELGNNSLLSLEGLENFPHLKVLYLNVDISSFREFPLMPELEDLGLSNSVETIKSVAGLENFSHLKRLYFSFPFKNLENFPQMNELEALHVPGGRLESLAGLSEKFPRLKTLYVINNKITSLEGIGSLDELGVLSMPNNQLTSLRGFPPKLMKLGRLDLRCNNLESLEGFPEAPELHALDVRWNKAITEEKLQVLRGKVPVNCRIYADSGIYNGNLEFQGYYIPVVID